MIQISNGIVHISDDHKGAMERVVVQLDAQTPEEFASWRSDLNWRSDLKILKGLLEDLGVAGRKKSAKPVDIVDADDQAQALREGWCLIENSAGWLEIQADDVGVEFSNDELACDYVMERAEQGSACHRRVLSRVTDENQRRLKNNSLAQHDTEVLPWIFLWRRTWYEGSVEAQSVVKVMADYSPRRGVVQPATERLQLDFDEDLASLHESRAIPDLTYELEGFICVKMYAQHPRGYPGSVECGGCGYVFSVDPCTGANSKAIIVKGRVINVSRCPRCGALYHGPKKRE